MSLRNDLRKKWEALGYSPNAASAAVVEPPQAEFIRVYHIMPADYAISAIALSRLKVARFADVNDPFELLAMSFRDGAVRVAVKEFKEAYNKQYGLLCFSDDWLSPVLWSHYGSKHAGVCLGFNLRRAAAEKVHYVDQRLTEQLGDGDPPSLSEELRKKLRSTKFFHWSYEQEWRMFVPLQETVREGTLYFRRFNPDLELAEVVLGPLCDLSLDSVRELVWSHYPRVAVFGARPAYKWFSVVPIERTLAGSAHLLRGR